MTDFETNPVGTGKRIEQLVATCEELEAKLKTSEEIGRAFEEDAGQLLEKLAEALDALLFYSDQDNYENQEPSIDDAPPFYCLPSLIENDGGKIARATIAALKGQDDE